MPLSRLRSLDVPLLPFWLLLLACLLSVPLHAAANDSDREWQRIRTVFPQAEALSEPAGDFQVRTVTAGGKTLAYAFQTRQVVDIPAYSGKPVNLQVLLGPDGVIRDAYVLEHHEPILLVGIPEQKLHDFTDKYRGVEVSRRVVVGHSSDPETITVDAVTGATVTVMVVNETIMRAAHKVAVSLGLVDEAAARKQKPALIRRDLFQPADWTALTGNGAIRRLHLTRGQVDDAFVGSPAEGVEAAPADHRDDTFIDLYVAQLDVPGIGRNLLGENQFDWLTGELKPGEHAIVLLGNGLYSFKGSGYVRGGIFDRIQMRQGGETISFRDLDFQRLGGLRIEGAPDFAELGMFIVRDHHEFDPGNPWGLELLVRRQTGPTSGEFASFQLDYQLPNAYFERPAPTAEELAAAEEAARPMWVSIWYGRAFQIGVLGVGLGVLLVILFLQDYFVRFPRLLHNLRRAYLVFTVGFIGWYALGQLSIVNVLTFVHALMEGFRWELFLSDPILFILWTFTAASILLWGRGVFCGWLCPFGALQELINEVARKLKVRQFELPFAVHERLWAVKYLILLALFGLSLESMATAERFAEVEPFKTAITLKFDRQWWFVLYVVILLVINVFTRKVYCRYICPLGAALAIPSRLRLFDWLKRRKECGTPCQLCAHECEIQAIHPDGRIDANECHHCLDCQVTYHNASKCPPLIAKRKRRQRDKTAPVAAMETIAVVQLDIAD